MTIDLSMACADYEWTKPLWDGRVEPDGFDLSLIDYPNPERFTRMVKNLEFDVCELSFGTYLTTRAAEESFPFTAIPVFPHRRFRHSYMYKRTGAGIDDPTDLEGRKVGIVNWQTTTGIWQRGILNEHYGVDTTAIEWYAAGSEIVDIGTLERYDVEYVREWSGSTPHLEGLMQKEAVDAIFHPVRLDVDNAERLFGDSIDEERQYYEETSIFPIMHTIVVRDRLLEEHPWIVQPLYDAFERSKEIGLDRLDRPQWMPLVWARNHVEMQRSILGDDPWEYGLTESNRTTLETLVRYAHEQELIPERYDLESLFELEAVTTKRFG